MSLKDYMITALIADRNFVLSKLDGKISREQQLDVIATINKIIDIIDRVVPI